jgi:hypothetical protein
MTLDMQQVLDNIKQLYNTYGRQHISSDKRLLLLYWRDIDGVDVTKEHFSTKQWMDLSTDPIVIINGKMLLQSIYESEK